MPVYIIRAGQHGPVKIGFTNDLAKRLVELQVGNHERLTILRIFEGGQAEEAQLHERFAENRLHGEWHSFSQAMLGPALLGLRDLLTEPAKEIVVPVVRTMEEARAYDETLRILIRTRLALEARDASRGLMRTADR
jgi:hypothetical protein